MAEILIKGAGIGNDHSDVDGIGAPIARIPYDLYLRINAIPEFDWVMETNEGIALFIKLNPQFFYDNFKKFGAIKEYPEFMVHKNGEIYNLKTRKFVSRKMKGHYAGK